MCSSQWQGGALWTPWLPPEPAPLAKAFSCQITGGLRVPDFPSCLVACNHCQSSALRREKTTAAVGSNVQHRRYSAALNAWMLELKKQLCRVANGVCFLMFKFSTNVLAARNRQVPQASQSCRGGHVGSISALDTLHKATACFRDAPIRAK